MSRFINPFTDVGFKRIFGQEVNKDLLIDFLNGLLYGERHIEDLTFLDKEQLPDLSTTADRSLIYDIYCRTSTGEHIIVEMQNKSQNHFKERAVYYMSNSIVNQGKRGDWKYDVKAVYGVFFMNFATANFPNKFRTDVALMDMQDKEIFSDRIRMTFIQLPLFHKEVDDCKNDFERWIYVLKNMENLNRMPWGAQDAVFKKLFEIADVASMTPRERDMYNNSLKVYRDGLVVYDAAVEEGMQKGMQEGMQKGMQEGMEKGMQKGMQEEKIQTARRLKAMNMNVDTITQATGLSAEEIARIE